MNQEANLIRLCGVLFTQVSEAVGRAATPEQRARALEAHPNAMQYAFIVMAAIHMGVETEVAKRYLDRAERSRRDCLKVCEEIR